VKPSLCSPLQGSGALERVGNSVWLHKVLVSGDFHVPAEIVPAETFYTEQRGFDVRILLVMDTQAIPGSPEDGGKIVCDTNGWVTSYLPVIYAPRNPFYEDRFIILDEVVLEIPEAQFAESDSDQAGFVTGDNVVSLVAPIAATFTGDVVLTAGTGGPVTGLLADPDLTIDGTISMFEETSGHTQVKHYQLGSRRKRFELTHTFKEPVKCNFAQNVYAGAESTHLNIYAIHGGGSTTGQIMYWSRTWFSDCGVPTFRK